jgi:hypothetical protein
MWNVARTSSQRPIWTIAIAIALVLSPVLSLADSSTPMPVTAGSAGDVVSSDGAVFARSDKSRDKAGSASADAGKPRALVAGDYIYPQDVINTGSDSHVKILLKDHSIVELGSSSLFRVDQFKGKGGGSDREVEVSLPYGTMRAAIAQKLTGSGKFKVRTPSATMGVRGTEFVVHSEMSSMKQLGQMMNHPGSMAPPPSAEGGRGPASAVGATSVTVLQGNVAMSHRNFDASASGGRNPSSASGNSTDVVSIKAGSQLTSGDQAGASGTGVAAKPVQVDAQQLASISSSSHVADTTFSKAVTVDATAPASSASTAVSTSIAQIVAIAAVNVPPPPKINPGDVGIPGAFTTTQALAPPPANIQAPTHNVHIVIVSGN